MAEDTSRSEEVARAAESAKSELDARPAPPHDVLRRPLDLSYDERRDALLPQGIKKMSEGLGSPLNGQYRALETRVDNLKEDYERLSHNMETQFAGTNARLDSIVSALGSKGNGDFTKYAGVIAIIVGIATGIISGFVTLENNSINSSIAAQGAALSSSLAELKTTFGKDVARVEKRQDAADAAFVGRPELTGWKTEMSGTLAEVRRTQDDHTKTIANLVADVTYQKNDVERFKSIAVSRSEIDGNKSDTVNRLNLLSNRVTDVAKDLSAVPILVENQRQIRTDLTDLTRRLVATPESRR